MDTKWKARTLLSAATLALCLFSSGAAQAWHHHGWHRWHHHGWHRWHHHGWHQYWRHPGWHPWHRYHHHRGWHWRR